jgi:hypothetical protein
VLIVLPWNARERDARDRFVYLKSKDSDRLARVPKDLLLLVM